MQARWVARREGRWRAVERESDNPARPPSVFAQHLLSFSPRSEVTLRQLRIYQERVLMTM